MIICVCANVSDKQVKSVLNETCSLKAVREQTGACKDCGICKKEIMKLIDKKIRETAKVELEPTVFCHQLVS